MPRLVRPLVFSLAIASLAPAVVQASPSSDLSPPYAPAKTRPLSGTPLAPARYRMTTRIEHVLANGWIETMRTVSANGPVLQTVRAGSTDKIGYVSGSSTTGPDKRVVLFRDTVTVGMHVEYSVFPDADRALRVPVSLDFAFLNPAEDRGDGISNGMTNFCIPKRECIQMRDLSSVRFQDMLVMTPGQDLVVSRPIGKDVWRIVFHLEPDAT